MRNYFKSLKVNKGFTLIELLVVIGILGILAAALIATIDPFEQLKKASDSNVKNTAVEFVDASIRYYTTHNALPWATSLAANCGTPADSTIVTANLGAAGLPCLQALIGDNELESGFTTVTSVIDSIYVTGSWNSVTACFQPQSKSQQGDANTKYDVTGNVLTNVCTSQTAGGSTSCYWCAE